MDFWSNFQKNLQFSHNKVENPHPAEFHLHNFFEIYFFIKGDVKYFIEKKVYNLDYCDLLIMNDHEIHKPTFMKASTYERYVIHFTPEFAKIASSHSFDLLNCFINRPHGEKNKINLSEVQRDDLLKLFNKLDYIYLNKLDGWQSLAFSCFIEILVLINRAFLSIFTEDKQTGVHEKLLPILNYINDNLDSDLSLEVLEAKFFLDKFYMSRLFRKCIGSSLHQYILIKRISKAKMLLSQGYSVTNSAHLSGFGDYSNFNRMFKKITGRTPSQYLKEYTHSSL